MSAVVGAIAVGGGLAMGLGGAALVGAGVAGVAGGLMMQEGRENAAEAQAAQERAAAGLASSSDYAANLSYKLGQENLAFEKQQYAEMKPLAERVSRSQIAAQEEQMRQGRDYYDYQTGTFRPIEQGLVRQAEQFDTEAYREQLASQAAADVSRAFGVAQGMTTRDLARRGVGPNSGNALAMGNQNALALASARAGAATGARNQAEQLGYARKLDVTGLGRGLAGASTAAYGAATGAGTAGLTSAMAPGAQYSTGANRAAGIMTTGAGQQISGYSSLYGGATSLASAAMQEQAGMTGSLLGMAGTLGAGYLGRK
jgi:hypothetical protein